MHRHARNTTHASGSDWLTTLTTRLRWTFGLLLTINFALLWALPIAIQGQVYKLWLYQVLDPVYALIDRSSALRRFATRFVYAKPVHADFFAKSLLLVLSTALAFGVVLHRQIAHGSMPIWLILLYYLAWVGFGGRIMGAAYTFAHKEGHRPGGRLYRPWIRNSLGNFFENWLGFFYGNVPYNFSTAHNLLHHRLNAGKGDPVYLWDLDRTSWSDLMLYQHRIFVYMTGWGSLRAFKNHGSNNQITTNYKLLRKGFILYWFVGPTIILSSLMLAGNTAQSALSFLFFIYIQPLFAMSCFLGFINFALHGFVEFKKDGAHIPCINSITIIDGQDDSFGEDDHMAHHYYMGVEHVDLKKHQRSQEPEWIRRHASVFKELSILELSLYMLLNKWHLIAEKHYVDYSGALTTDETARMLKERAQRKEMSYEEYEFSYRPAIRSTAEEIVRRGYSANLAQAYRYQAHHNNPEPNRPELNLLAGG